MSETVIQLENVDKFFGPFQALKNISLAVKKGERIVVCGPSGSGKSTLIRCINRLEEHSNGKIVVNGHELTGDVKNIDAVRRVPAPRPLLSGRGPRPKRRRAEFPKHRRRCSVSGQ